MRPTGTSVRSADNGCGLATNAIQAKPECGAAALNVKCSSRATGSRQDECPNVKYPDDDCLPYEHLRALRATGFQEISPVLRALYPSRECANGHQAG